MPGRDEPSGKQTSTDAATRLPPVVAIYQNPDYVAGLVQQIFEAPLVQSVIVDADHTHEATKDDALSGTGGAAAKGSLPGVGAVHAELGGAVSHAAGTAITTSSRSSQSFVYSQSYYLGLVRHALRERELLTVLNDASAITAVGVGDFVEFKATFSAPSLPSMMDVLTPDLIGAIAEYMTRKSGRDSIDFSDFASLKGAAANVDMNATANRDIATSVTRALQADFRQAYTREYYGRIEGVAGYTAITICDANRFLVEDEDRILDGAFMVLGKVTSLPRENMPVLERNKLLRNVAPSAVDKLLGDAKKALESSARGLPVDEEQVNAMMQVELDSRVPGQAFRVIPIAIFV